MNCWSKGQQSDKKVNHQNTNYWWSRPIRLLDLSSSYWNAVPQWPSTVPCFSLVCCEGSCPTSPLIPPSLTNIFVFLFQPAYLGAPSRAACMSDTPPNSFRHCAAAVHSKLEIIWFREIRLSFSIRGMFPFFPSSLTFWDRKSVV